MRFHAIQNVETALRFLRYKEIKLVNIRGEDIVDGNPKLTLGLIWTIILHFQVGEASINPRKVCSSLILAQTGPVLPSFQIFFGHNIFLGHVLNIFLFPAAQAGIAARHHNQVGSIASNLCSFGNLVARYTYLKYYVNFVVVPWIFKSSLNSYFYFHAFL